MPRHLAGRARAFVSVSFRSVCLHCLLRLWVHETSHSMQMFACWPRQVGKAVKCLCIFLCYSHRHICIKLLSTMFESWSIYNHITSGEIILSPWLGHVDCSVDLAAVSSFSFGVVWWRLGSCAGALSAFVSALCLPLGILVVETPSFGLKMPEFCS